MNNITLKSTVKEILELPEFEQIRHYLIYSPVVQLDRNDHFTGMSVKALAGIGWIPEEIISGIHYLLDQMEKSRFELHFVYDNCADDPMEKDVNLMCLKPEKEDQSKPYIVLAAGGGYQGVCTMVEALPTARHFTEAGYTVFLLTYRVSAGNTLEKALDDLAEAFRYIESKKDHFQVVPDRYALGGFSAGGNLISCWGVPGLGWQKHGIAKPLVMFPIYALIDLEQEKHPEGRDSLLDVMFKTVTEEKIREYNVAEFIDSNYPPCYLVCGKDDMTVPPANSVLFKRRLDQAGVPAALEEGEHAQHGFGDGTNTDVEGWPERAIHFLEEVLS